MSRKKVAFIHHRYGYGGASKALRFYAECLVEKGASVRIIFYDGDGSEHGAFAPEIDLRSTGPRAKNPLLRRAVQIIESLRAVKEFRADIVIGLMPVNAMVAVIVGRLVGARVIGSERGNPYSHKGFNESLKRIFMRLADGAIFQTEGARDFYGARLSAKSVVIPNTVAPSLSQIPFTDKQNECAFFSRFDLRNKRFDLLFDAFGLVCDVYPEMVLNIFGSGSPEEEAQVRKLCSDRGLSQNVVFHGAVNGTYAYMEKYRYFLLTSDSEGMPNALMEAMACGMVCVTTDCEPGGARFLIKDGVNGHLVDRGDKIEFSRRIISCLDDPQMAQKVSRNARSICDRLSKQAIADALATFVLSR